MLFLSLSLSLVFSFVCICSATTAANGEPLPPTAPATSTGVFSAVDELNALLDQNRRLLIVHIAKNGLANRLRTIADWYTISQTTNRILVINWLPQFECNAKFHHLFDTNSMNISDFRVLRDLLPDGIAGQNIVRLITSERHQSFTILADPTDFFLNNSSSVYSSTIDVTMTSYSGQLAAKDMTCSQYLTGRQTFLSGLQPVSKLKYILADLKQYFANSIMVGVHYRSHDPSFDWAVVPPMISGDTALQFGEGATLEDFQIRMTSLLNSKKQNIRFFFTSNDKTAKEHMLAVFGNRVVVLNGPSSRGSDGHVEFAALEWFALAQSDLIFHTKYSSFAEEAAAAAAPTKNTPLVSLWHHKIFFSRSKQLVQCGVPFYMKTNDKVVQNKSYIEGTHDSRIVNDTYVSLRPCPFLKNWFFSDLFCSV